MNHQPSQNLPDSSPLQLLAREPFRFDFFQAVRLLVNRDPAQQPERIHSNCVGEDSDPANEVVRFRADVSLSYPSGPIRSFQLGVAEDSDDESTSPPVMTVAFMGLTGPSGVLPRHYTQTMIDCVKNRDYAMRDFFDLFNHRTISHFYRVWVKYHFPTLYESAARTPTLDEDIFTGGLYGIIGLGTPRLRGRFSFDDEQLIHYGGVFAHFPRNAISLERVIEDYFGIAAEVLQFLGQWLRIEPADQTRLQTPRHGRGWNNVLGSTAIAGEKVWGVESKFRIRLGPVNLGTFLRYSPMGNLLVPLAQLVRMYAGPDLDFDIQPVLCREEIPDCQLGGSSPAPLLGWTTWLKSQPAKSDSQDAVFVCEGNPLPVDAA